MSSVHTLLLSLARRCAFVCQHTVSLPDDEPLIVRRQFHCQTMNLCQLTISLPADAPLCVSGLYSFTARLPLFVSRIYSFTNCQTMHLCLSVGYSFTATRCAFVSRLYSSIANRCIFDCQQTVLLPTDASFIVSRQFHCQPMRL